jgi:hypothetical protein
MRLLPILISAALAICSCKDQSSGKKTVLASSAEKKDSKYVNRAEVKNGIDIEASGGVKVEKAYLTLPDGTPLGDKNVVDLNQKAILHLDLSDWKVENGKTYLGASEEIKTDNGTEILKIDDLFSNYDPQGIDPNDAKYIVLSAVITGQTGKIDHFVVSFRVWDKKGSSVISGSYPLYIR